MKKSRYRHRSEDQNCLGDDELIKLLLSTRTCPPSLPTEWCRTNTFQSVPWFSLRIRLLCIEIDARFVINDQLLSRVHQIGLLLCATEDIWHCGSNATVVDFDSVLGLSQSCVTIARMRRSTRLFKTSARDSDGTTQSTC